MKNDEHQIIYIFGILLRDIVHQLNVVHLDFDT
jgi:hypothetical protein